MPLLLLFAAGAVGGITISRLKVPAGAMIGAMAFVAIANVLFSPGISPPSAVQVAVQVCSGMIIGSRITRRDVQELKLVFVPAILLVVMLYIINIAFACLVSAVSSIDLVTALFACAPGGVTDLALVAMDFGVDSASVTLLQLIRFVFVVSFFPVYMRRHFLREKSASQAKETQAPCPQQDVLTVRDKALRLLLTVLCGLALGLLARFSGIPAGALIGSLVGTAAAGILTGKTFIPKHLRTATQIFAGSYIGLQVTRGVVLSLGTLVVPALILLVEMLVMAFGCSFVLERLLHMDHPTALFSSIPGGIAEMGLIAEELNLDMPKIMVLHTCRLLSVICLLPVFVKVFSG